MINDFDVKDLQLVRLTAEDGSLTSAARRMHVSQPAVSQRLANLQKRIGTDLFVRKDGLMRPTRAGQRLVSAAESVAGILASAAADIRDIRDDRASRLRVATQCYTCYRWLPFVISKMHAMYPDLAIDVDPEATDTPYEALDEERIDIAVISNPRNEAAFAEHRLFEDELYAVMSSDNVLASRSFLTPANFREQTLVLYTGNRHAILEEVLFPAAVSPARVIQVRITEAIVELARSGQGLAVLSGWAFNDLDNRQGLTAVRIGKGGFKRQWRAVAGINTNDEHVAAFVKCVQDIGTTIHMQAWRRKLQARSKPAASAANGSRRRAG
jgi:LysR family transcriptional regulator for metE and metH